MLLFQQLSIIIDKTGKKLKWQACLYDGNNTVTDSQKKNTWWKHLFAFLERSMVMKSGSVPEAENSIAIQVTFCVGWLNYLVLTASQRKVGWRIKSLEVKVWPTAHDAHHFVWRLLMGKMKKLMSFAVRISAIATHLRSHPSKCCLIRGIRITLAVIAETNFFFFL